MSDTKRRRRSTLHYPFDTAPQFGELRAVAEGVYWFRMPLPFADGHINLWLLEDEDSVGPGWAVVDTGQKTHQAVELWRALIAPGGAIERAGRPPRVTRVICTHFHTDHAGMAGWLTRKFQCPLWMTRGEYLTFRMRLAEWGRPAPEESIAFYASCGWAPAHVERYKSSYGRFAAIVHRFPENFERLTAGQELIVGRQRWEVFVGSGHSPEHASLINDSLGVVIAGDQVLPDISSNVSVVVTEPNGDPLGSWMDSLRRLRSRCDNRVVVLPAHGLPFIGLHERLDDLLAKHESALTALAAELQLGPRRVVDVFKTLFRRRVDDTFERLHFATGESLAHLNHLLKSGAASRFLDGDGMNWYRGE